MIGKDVFPPQWLETNDSFSHRLADYPSMLLSMLAFLSVMCHFIVLWYKDRVSLSRRRSFVAIRYRTFLLLYVFSYFFIYFLLFQLFLGENRLFISDNISNTTRCSTFMFIKNNRALARAFHVLIREENRGSFLSWLEMLRQDPHYFYILENSFQLDARR